MTGGEERVLQDPILVMIGGMRCGTRALQRYLSQHPQILPHQRAHDPHFFSNEENWKKGVASYLEGWSAFDPAQHVYRFESSTHYTKYPAIRNVPERMRESGLNFVFIYGVRDPLARIESHLQHNAGKGYVNPESPEARARFLESAVAYSSYDAQLQRFRKAFPEKNFFVYTLEELQEDPESLLRRLLDSIELDPNFRFETVKRIGTKFRAPVEKAQLTEGERRQAFAALVTDGKAFMCRHRISPAHWPQFTALAAEATHAEEQQRETRDATEAEIHVESGIVLDSELRAPALRRSFSGEGRFAFLTVDTEALPYRATGDHVRRLIWGEHPRGVAGIREIAAIGREFGAPHVFFLDMCEAELYGSQIEEVAQWLAQEGEDVQLHAHPELLPSSFWKARGMPAQPKVMNEYGYERARFVLSHFADRLEAATGTAVQAFRAGSFRWNSDTIRAMADAGLSLSFNDTLKSQRLGRNPFSTGDGRIYRWSNGVVEVPLTERDLPNGERAALSFPTRQDGAHRLERIYDPYLGETPPDCLVLLLHSWSLLHWDTKRRAEYRDDQRAEDYRALVRQISRDYDVITASQYVELLARGEGGAPPLVSLDSIEQGSSHVR